MPKTTASEIHSALLLPLLFCRRADHGDGMADAEAAGSRVNLRRSKITLADSAGNA
jgi:hypothetical protein